jgi:integral membrane protein (TIGR01906 family)
MQRLQRPTMWIISLTIPFLLMMTAIRLLLTPLFARIEYSMPNFPADPYGFSHNDRLFWSEYAINYLTNSSEIICLQNLNFPDGTSLYNERELSHMEDVKFLVKDMIISWSTLLIFQFCAGFWAWRSKWPKIYIHAIGRGGWLTIGLMVAILLGVFTGFDALFTGFHKLFFEGSTWLFLFSDTLIRLFPMRFWQDAFILVGSLTLLGAIFLILLDRKYRYNSP